MVKLRRAECGFRLPSIVRAGWVRVAETFAWDLMAASSLLLGGSKEIERERQEVEAARPAEAANDPEHRDASG